ncbi:hypothetical protein B0T17DRAFT_613761 [Bombardia bombarda]|uniref:Uncharacterized protein n=1 Tax=Bombardia bombarda TaxID=252184 RepID=A0AA39XN71_9PEZI|nr:hypothetical protein B0T17DRAFT_613761 [Bombardia bombarda]
MSSRAASALLPKETGVAYSLIKETATEFLFSAALEDFGGPAVPIDRYLITIDRHSSKVMLPPCPIVISTQELTEAILTATGQHLQSAERLTDGMLSVSYKVMVEEDQDIAYIGVSYTPGGAETEGNKVRKADHELCTRRYGIYDIPWSATRPFQACWEVPLPEPRRIGELVVAVNDDNGKEDVILTVGPDRHHSLGGPFDSVREYLAAWVRAALRQLEKQQGVDEYKEKKRKVKAGGEAASEFLTWFRFGMFMKPEPPPKNLSDDDKRAYWAENVRVVEEVLGRYKMSFFRYDIYM